MIVELDLEGLFVNLARVASEERLVGKFSGSYLHPNSWVLHHQRSSVEVAAEEAQACDQSQRLVLFLWHWGLVSSQAPSLGQTGLTSVERWRRGPL